MAASAHNSLAGYQGRISIPVGALTYKGTTASVIHVTSLESEYRPEVVDNSTFDDASNAKRKLRTMYDMAGRCEGYLDRGNPLLSVPNIGDETVDGTVAGFKIWPKHPQTTNSQPAYTFTGIITNLRISAAKTGRATFTCSFESSGDVTETTTASYP